MLGVDERRPSGNGIKTPMNENAEFGVGVPLRKLMLVEGFEGRFVVGGDWARRRDESKKQKKKRMAVLRDLQTGKKSISSSPD